MSVEAALVRLEALSARQARIVEMRCLGAPATLRLDGAANAMAFDAAGGVQAVTRTGAVVHATTDAVATTIDHGAHRGVPVQPASRSRRQVTGVACMTVAR